MHKTIELCTQPIMRTHGERSKRLVYHKQRILLLHLLLESLFSSESHRGSNKIFPHQIPLSSSLSSLFLVPFSSSALTSQLLLPWGSLAPPPLLLLYNLTASPFQSEFISPFSAPMDLEQRIKAYRFVAYSAVAFSVSFPFLPSESPSLNLLHPHPILS